MTLAETALGGRTRREGLIGNGLDRLRLAVSGHRAVEEDFRRRLLCLCPFPEELAFPNLGLPAEEYLQRNFFSILFMSIFSALDLSVARQRLYGLILHAARGIVTSSDNILDREDKGAVRLRLGHRAVLSDIMLMLLQDGVIHDAIAGLTREEAVRRRAREAFIQALLAIGREEADEECGVDIALKPEELLTTIHSFRGGRLLQLAFVAPDVIETALRERLSVVKRGVYDIGISLQVLDDITDFSLDLSDRHHSILRSWVVHHAPDGAMRDDEIVKLSPSLLDTPETTFPIATAQVLQLAMSKALSGFDRLAEARCWGDRSDTWQTISLMFRLRGLERLWQLCEAMPDASGLAARYST
jgi:hypothetical protein